MDQLRIFISSPGDVDEERRRAAIVIQRIRREFSRFFDVSAILWEYDPMLSSGNFQDVIEKPSNTDIVVLILWSRLGTPLPPRYQGMDGRTPVTGTEWEFEDALAAKLKVGTPDLLVYRKTAPPTASFADAQMLTHAQEQWQMLQGFWLRHFVEADGTFKAAFNQFAALDEFEHELEMHLRALLHARVSKRLRDEGKRPISWHSGSPYRGLAAFDPEHAAIFFGREKAEQELVEVMARRAQAGTAFVAVFGASGSGKSSLLRAGVIPTVESPGVVAGVTRWRRVIVTPAALGADPFWGLANALLDGEVLPEAALAGDAAYWARQMCEHPVAAAAGIRATLAAAAKAASLPGGELPLRMFLLVDQLEEIFTSFDAASRTAFIALLKALAKCGAVWVAATMRSDFFARVSESETLAALTAGEGGYALAAPRPPEIERMIGKPAEAAGITFEVDPATGIGLDAELLAAATGSPGALPLLEFTLDELYRHDIEKAGGSFLTFATFKTLGGLEGAIAARAEETVNAQPADIAAALPGLIHALVHVGDDNRVGARTARITELKATPQGAALTDALVAARLLIVSDDTARVAHEALLKAWPRAASLIAEDLDMLRARARVHQALDRWRCEGDVSDFLLPRGRALGEAVELLNARRAELSPDLIRYVEASVAADEARRQAELAAERAQAEALAETERQKAQRALDAVVAAHRLTRRTRTAAAVLAVLLLAAIGAGAYAFLQRNEAMHQRIAAQTSQSYVLTNASFAASDNHDSRLARLLALAALPASLAHPDKPYSDRAQSALARAWGDDRLIAVLPPQAGTSPSKPVAKLNPKARGPKLAALLMGVVGSSSRTFAFSGQGGDHTVISGDGKARVYDADVRLVLDVPHTADKGAVALDAAGARLAQGEGSGVRLWDVVAKTSRLLPGGSDVVLKLAFSPDGRFLVAGGAAGGVSIWSLPDGKRIEVPGVFGVVRDLRTSPNRLRAVVMGEDGRAGLYDLGAGRQIAVLGDAAQRNGDALSRALRQGIAFLTRFSDDGSLLVTATSDTRVQLWDANSGAALGGPMVQDSAVQDFSFPKGNEQLEVRLLDGRRYLWSRHWPGEARVIWPHAVAVAAAPDTEAVLITDADGLSIIDGNGRKLRTLLAGTGLTGSAWSPDGKTALVTQNGTDVLAMPIAGGPARTIYRAPAGDRIGVADFTSGSRRVVVQTYGGLAVLIDPANGRPVARIGDGQESLAYIAHSDAMGAFWKDGRAVVYDADGKATRLDTPKDLSIIGMSGNGDAGLVATVGVGSAIRFWDIKTGKPAGQIMGAQSLAALRANFRPGPGGWIATADINQNILVWPWPDRLAVNARPAQTLPGHEGLVTRLRATPDGRLVSDGKDHRAIVWDPLAGVSLAHYENAADTRMSLDGKRLLIVDTDGAVRLANLPPSGQALIDQARARYGAFTPDEQVRYHLTAAGEVQ